MKCREKTPVFEVVKIEFVGIHKGFHLIRIEGKYPKWLKEAERELKVKIGPLSLEVVTRNGVKEAGVNYYIMKDENGNLDVCEPYVFESTYDVIKCESVLKKIYSIASRKVISGLDLSIGKEWSGTITYNEEK